MKLFGMDWPLSGAEVLKGMFMCRLRAMMVGMEEKRSLRFISYYKDRPSSFLPTFAILPRKSVFTEDSLKERCQKGLLRWREGLTQL